MESEIRHLKMCNHPNIIKLRAERCTDQIQYLFFDHCNGGTLSDLNNIAETLSEGIVRSIGL